MLRILLMLVLLVTGIVAQSQVVDKQKLDKYFNTLVDNNRFMGSVVVYEGNKINYLYYGGLANVAEQKPLSDVSLFRIGSVTKTYTATLILKAVEEKKLRLSQTIDKYFPAIKHADKITIQHLLNHHSGIHNFTNSEGFGQWTMQQRTNDELLQRIVAGGSDFIPGTKGEYSNSNYVLLSILLEKIYKQPYDAILQKKIIKPLGLVNTAFGVKAAANKNAVQSYVYDGAWKEHNLTTLSVPAGAGAIVSTATDVAMFAKGLYNGKLINEQSLKAMQTLTDGYGLGMFKQTVFGDTVYTHDGVIDGFYSFFYYFPKTGITYVLLTNARNYDLKKINQTVFQAVTNKSFELPAFNTYEVTADMLQPYLGVYTSAEIPLVITVSNNGNVLLAHPDGQQVYTMEAMSKDNFSHEATGVDLEFIPDKKQMILKQGGQRLVFSKKE